MKALDLSYADPPFDWFVRRKAEGVGLIVPCLWTGLETPAPALSNLSKSVTAGMLIAGYYNYQNHGLQRARAAAEPYFDTLNFLAVDAELDSQTYAETMIATLEVADQDLRPIIYTREEFWRRHFFNFLGSRVGLWAAIRDGWPDLVPVDFGGWTSTVGKQYDSVTLDGYEVDLNTFDDAFITGTATPPAPPSQEDDMPLNQADFDGIRAIVREELSASHSGAPGPAPGGPQAPRTYTVQPGDSLSVIAQAVYDDASRWPEIAAANNLQDPYLIHPGDTLTIP